MATRKQAHRKTFMERTRSIYNHMFERAKGRVDFTLDQLRARVEQLMQTRPYCVYCKKQLDFKTWSLDHIIPISRGGTFDESNTQIICSSCNKAKGNWTDAEFRGLISSLLTLELEHKNFNLYAYVMKSMAIANSFRQGAMRRAKR